MGIIYPEARFLSTYEPGNLRHKLSFPKIQSWKMHRITVICILIQNERKRVRKKKKKKLRLNSPKQFQNLVSQTPLGFKSKEQHHVTYLHLGGGGGHSHFFMKINEHNTLYQQN